MIYYVIDNYLICSIPNNNQLLGAKFQICYVNSYLILLRWDVTNINLET